MAWKGRVCDRLCESSRKQARLENLEPASRDSANFYQPSQKLTVRLCRGIFHIIPKASAPSRVGNMLELGSRPYEAKRRSDWPGIRRRGARGISTACRNPDSLRAGKFR